MKNLIFFLAFIVIGGAMELKAQDQDQKDMKYMLEEEKLARDVYFSLGEKWGLRVFNNIKKSEQWHMDMMKNLLETKKTSYSLNEERGVFFNQELQKMYNSLVERGLKSQQEALQVGKLIEETDIADLEKAIANTNDADIKQVYTYLLKASHNHLRAFSRQLSRY